VIWARDRGSRMGRGRGVSVSGPEA
jgi:hypothetical protein